MSVMLPQKILQEEIYKQQLPVQEIYDARRKETPRERLGLNFTKPPTISFHSYCPCCGKPLKPTQKQVIVHSSCQKRMSQTD